MSQRSLCPVPEVDHEYYRKKVIDFLSKEYERDITTEEEFREAIQLLDNDQTVRAWRELWEGSQKGFCKFIRANEGNFSRWKNHKKRSYVSALKTKRFLSGCKYEFRYADLSKKDLYNIIEKRSRDKECPLRGIIFVDADNITKMDEFREIVGDVTRQWNIHVVFSIARDIMNCVVVGLETSPWLSIVHPQLTGKEAVDHNVSFLVGAIDMLLQERKDIFFRVMSNDHFAKLVCAEAGESGREVSVIDWPDRLIDFV